MTKRKVTESSILLAAIHLLEGGEPISVRRIRKTLGEGSHETINKTLQSEAFREVVRVFVAQRRRIRELENQVDAIQSASVISEECPA
ncbi:DNA-binding protein [Denitromonas ohlonensis]|uniref:KfrA N-terminal DNA-binding domain-containing protein n=2 Tax=Denitromonas TaxID=139331 RepID=A0A557REK0_9RHOO|nr:hypothetical protein FHP90_13980 [Denitromonas ohlonensis]TVO75459.1 hypothetical protein FHP89_14015 [Denitromonas ohlonensis]TVT48711.1 MAG: hypothetical protein FHP94_09420 [Denitromonas halophila]TVT70545.1 MAG: hypothetical protein FHP92_17595 [Denitromonas halophila]TVT75667.1 MAG: hypothetical protein FHP93_00220 [Denitromonas halophila]